MYHVNLKNIYRPLTTILNVPRVIYRTHNSLFVPKSMVEACHDEWLRLNPEHNLIWFDNLEQDKFMNTMDNRIVQAYKKIQPGAYKADLFRACLLFEKGGIYVDSYATPFEPLSVMLMNCWNNTGTDQFISVKDRGEWGVHNGFIVATPRHPFLRKYVNQMVEHIEQNYYGETDLDITGPRCLAKVVGGNKIGMNDRPNGLSFYLFELKSGWYQPVYKQDRVIMHKKYSLVHYFAQKVLNYSTTYKAMWEEKRVYEC